MGCEGSVAAGIGAFAWSPDQEVLALVTGAGDLLVMTQEFHVLSEQPAEPLRPGDGELQPVSVGWGRRETQFQGRAGKLSSQHPESGGASTLFDDGLPRISWRGDGEYFVTSSVKKPPPSVDEGPRRILYIWDRAGALQCTAADTSGLEPSLAWRPSGNLIATTQRLPHRHDVVFFERNGLRHGEFTLPFQQGEMAVQHLAWNCTSTVLAVWAEELPLTERSQQHLQLWTTGNYHW